jgi:phage protein U
MCGTSGGVTQGEQEEPEALVEGSTHNQGSFIVFSVEKTRVILQKPVK